MYLHWGVFTPFFNSCKCLQMVLRQFPEDTCISKLILVFPHRDHQCRDMCTPIQLLPRETDFALLRHFRAPSQKTAQALQGHLRQLFSSSEITAEESWVYFLSVDTSFHRTRLTTEHHMSHENQKPTLPHLLYLLASTLNLSLHHRRPQAVLLQYFITLLQRFEDSCFSNQEIWVLPQVKPRCHIILNNFTVFTHQVGF